MDVSFTNVLEGARQYFQGLPVPSTGDTAASTEHPLAISSASSSLPTSTGQQHDHAITPSSARPSSATAIPNPATSGQQETNSRYGNDVRSGESNGGAAASSSASFWSPQVEPYPPQPTRVEVPDTRPGDESSTLEPSSSSGPITLTEMQPSSHRATSSPSSSTGYAQKQSSVVALYTDNRHQQPCSVAAATSSSPNLHQMQTPQQLNHSPAPVYQHLTTAARTPYSASERHPTSHTGTYQSGNDRPSQPSAPIVTQRAQYYPRYHHPDITKSAPVPFSQNSIYQSASVASASSSNVQQPPTRSTPTEQSPAPHHGSAQDHPSQQDPSQQRVPPPSSYGSSVPLPSPVSSALYGSSTVPSRYHRSAGGPQQQASQQNCIGSASSGESRSSQHNSDGYMGHLPSPASSPSCSSSTACSPRHPGSGAGSNHIPSSASLGLPPHAAPLHHNPHQSSQQQQQQHSQYQHPSRLSGPLHSGVSSISSVGGSVGSNSYSGRMVLPHSGPSSSTSSSSSSSSASSNHSQQMPPPAAMGTYHPVASPHHEPPHHATPSPHRQSPHVAGLHNPHASSPHHAISPHNTFQPRSPTYPPPPPPARSTSHTYNLPATSQHYQSSGAGTGYPANPYAPPQPQSSYHSFQKSSQPPQSQPGTYYPQSKRSHGQAYVQPQTLAAPPGPPPPPLPPQASCSVSGSAGNYQPSKPITYNGTESKRAANPGEMGGVSYGCYRTGSAAPTMQRNASTHNLPPIAAVASYHSNRRETVGKAQSMQRQRMHSSGSSAAAATAKVSAVTSPTSSMIGGPQRIGDYPGTPPGPMNHAIPVNGRTTGVSGGTPSSAYRRYAIQQQCTAGYSTYAMTIAPSHHGSTSSTSTTVTSIEASGARASVPPIAIQAYQSSDGPGTRMEPPYHQHRHPPSRVPEEYGYKEHSYQNCSSSTGQPPTAVPATVATSSQISNGVRKRESPLDLSVKTVKTSADSTAQDDLEMISAEKHVTSSSLVSSRSNGTRPTMLPPVGQSPGSLPPPSLPAASYGTYDARVSINGTRDGSSSSSVPRTTTPQTVCAPKVDFLPDFNSTPLSPYHEQISQEGASRRSASQHVYAAHPQQPPPLSSQHATNPTPLPHMSTFKKSSLPSAPIYDGVAAPPPAPPPPTSYLSSGGELPASRTPSRYPPAQVLEPARMSSATLPLQDYPSDSAKYYHLEPKSTYGPQPPPTPPQRADRAGMLGKRPAPESTVYGGPVGKQPRLDTWRLAIDKQIQQRLSTARALHEQQKKQEMNNLPVPLPNGTLVTPGAYEQRSDSSGYSSSESARYQQAYCDKRTSYQEQKTIVRGTPSSYNHSMHGKPIHAMPPQQIITTASQMPPYSAPYRQTPQRVICPPSVPTSGQLPDQPSNTGADKRVLSLLRNSLENKQQKEEQLSGQQPILVNHSQQSFQNKVVTPVEPKTNVGRHNLSPFTAASLLERNSNTPPHYKFHMPRAVDSINQDAPRTLYGSRVNSSATLPGKEALLVPRAAESQIHRDKDDGLAAILLAAKIRTKAELKQVEGQFIGKSCVIPSQDASSTPKEFDSAASTSTPQSGSSAGSPPKLTREKTAALPPRRRLFSKTEEDNMPIAATVPVSAPVATVPSTMPARASGCRSSSETSVFDFRESDSEGEMPVLERQTLEGMRRDRKQLSKVQPPVPLNDAMCMGVTSSVDLVKIELKENDKINEVDPFWTATCDKFMEQLRTGDAAKKRGRKKKSEGGAAASSKTEDVSNDSPKKEDGNPQAVVKMEEEETRDGESDCLRDREDAESTKEEGETRQSIKLELKTEAEIKKEAVEERISDDDSDEVPLIERTTRKKTKKEDSDCDEDEGICRKRRVVRRGSRIKLESSSGSESSSEESDSSAETGQTSSVADRLRARKRSVNNNTAENEGMKLRSRDATPHKSKPEKDSKSSTSKNSAGSPKTKPKPLFGDGSDFRPGWEEEVYVYKKSLRMPTRLITVSKPSRFHRLSTSLPDLDPGSPALSVSMDSSDVCLGRKRIVDSDTESNCSFSTTGFGAGSKIDDEEATSSTTVSCPPKATKNTRLENNSIVDVLAQKVGTSTRDQRKKQREKLDKRSKVLRKGNNELELLPTPSLTPLLNTENSKPTKGKTPVRNNKSSKPIKVTDSFLLGYFRKETVNTFRDTFKNNHALPNEFSTFVLKSRTRTETRVLKKQATIREVFGEDRPASAPPMQNHDDTSQDDDSQNETRENNVGKARSLKQKVVSRLKNAGFLRSHKAIVNAKCHLLIAKRRKDLLKSLADKKLQRATAKVTEAAQKEGKDNRKVENNELEDDNNESEVPNKRKLKLRPGRRKFRSGFDYIRRKKKPLKKDESLPKERKRQVLSRPSPECVADIQTEIRTWVIKKGVGETILHRAARLGYTDVAAYCLEKLNSAPNPKDNAGYTPLHEACSKGHLEIAKLLLAYGANASESANGGIRPLHEAAENGATELVRLLLSYGADPLLATYSGQTPLMLAVDTEAYSILQQHLDDIQGRTCTPWFFAGPSSIFDPEETGYNPLDNPPLDSPEPELDEVEMEVSDVNLPVLFSLTNDPDKWVLLQDLMAALRIKSRDALLRQVNPKAHVGPPAIAHREVMRELKLPDFLEQSRCCHLLSGGERINVRGSKVTLIKYNDKVKSLLNVERVLISLR